MQKAYAGEVMEQQQWHEIPEVVDYVSSQEDAFYPVVLWMGESVGYGWLFLAALIGFVVLLIVFFKGRLKSLFGVIKNIWKAKKTDGK